MIKLWEMKTAQSGQQLVDSWNIPCQTWLKQCTILCNQTYSGFIDVYLRIRRIISNRTIAYAGTFLASAIWHVRLLSVHPSKEIQGFYPGYYLFFLSGAFFGVCAETMRAHLRHFVVNPDGSSKPIKALYDFLGWVLLFSAISYMTLAFRVGFVHLILLMSSIVVGLERIESMGQLVLLRAYWSRTGVAVFLLISVEAKEGPKGEVGASTSIICRF